MGIQRAAALGTDGLRPGRPPFDGVWGELRIQGLLSAAVLMIVVLSGVGASASTPSQMPQTGSAVDLTPVFADPWWPEWLAYHDLDGDRVDDALEAHASQGDARRLLPLIINFNRAVVATDADAVASRFAAMVTHQFRWIPALYAYVPADKVPLTGQLPGVVAVEWDRPLMPLLDVSAPATQSRGTTGGFYGTNTAE